MTIKAKKKKTDAKRVKLKGKKKLQDVLAGEGQRGLGKKPARRKTADRQRGKERAIGDWFGLRNSGADKKLPWRMSGGGKKGKRGAWLNKTKKKHSSWKRISLPDGGVLLAPPMKGCGKKNSKVPEKVAKRDKIASEVSHRCVAGGGICSAKNETQQSMAQGTEDQDPCRWGV